MITKLTPDMHGKKVSCNIYDTDLKEGCIVLHYSAYYLLSNERKLDGGNGHTVRIFKELKYKYAWHLANGKEHVFDQYRIKDLKILDSIVEDYQIY